MARALTYPEFDRLMADCGPFEQAPCVAVALSGGVDSTALALLAAQWARSHGGEAICLTVDHGLREASAAEAGQVAQWCAAHGLAHHVLRWQPGPLGGNVQQAARDARYALLGGWCARHHVLHLLTAHHADDQYETLLFRLARGSQLDGLACMASAGSTPGGLVRLLRPLLPVAKARLEATVTALGEGWIEDASNASEAYTRNRIRHATANGEAMLDYAAGLCQRLGNIRNHLSNKTVSSLSECVSLFPGGFAQLDAAAFAGLPAALRQRLLACLVPALNGQVHAPRSEQLAALAQQLAEGQAATLAGIQFVPKRGHVLAVREAAALGAPLLLRHGAHGMWDGRFSLWHDSGFSALEVRQVGTHGLTQVPPGNRGLRLWGRTAVSRMPGFWHLDSLVAAPHIEHYAETTGHSRFSAMLCTAKPLAARPFFGFNAVSA